jgi:hypothetical protein
VVIKRLEQQECDKKGRRNDRLEQISQRAVGRQNVFDATVTFGPSPCVLANQSASGIAAAYPTTTGRTQLILGLTNSSNTIGTMFFAQR